MRKWLPIVALIGVFVPYPSSAQAPTGQAPPAAPRLFAAAHDKDAELFHVVEGAGTLVTGGTLKDERRTNPDNLTGTAIEGGTSRKLAKATG